MVFIAVLMQALDKSSLEDGLTTCTALPGQLFLYDEVELATKNRLDKIPKFSDFNYFYLNLFYRIIGNFFGAKPTFCGQIW